MFSSCSGLTSLDLSNFNTDNVTKMWDMFSGCSGLNCLSLGADFNLNSIKSDSFFSSIGEVVPCLLIVPSELVADYMAAMNNGKLYGGKFFFQKGLSVTLFVVDESGDDITDNATILWYDSEGGQIGTGKTLYGIENGVSVYYSISLDEEKGRVYHEVNMRKITAESETVTCQLEKISRIMLEGRVSAMDIEDKTVTINVRQMLNGKYEKTYRTQTDEQGTFKIEVYDDETDITISGDGYLDATIHRDGFGDNGKVGTIPLNLISGFTIAANITMEKAIANGQAVEVAEWSDKFNNIEFTLYNETKKTEITDFTTQNGNIIIKSGADAGNLIRLTAKSRQHLFADATTTFLIEDGTNNFCLILTELGGIDVKYAASSNRNTIGYLYDADNTLVAKSSYVGEMLSLRHLPKGSYTLVSMGGSILLGNITNLSDFDEVGLSEGSDYVRTSVVVTDGLITETNINEVPRMDDTRFYYTSGNTYFNTDKTSLTAGNYLTLSAHIDFKPEFADKVNTVKLSMDLPEGCQIVESSVIANYQAVTYTINNSRLTMTLNKEQWQSQVRFCIIPTLNQAYTLTAIASFDINGNISQPIGTAQFEVKGLSLRTPKNTANTCITINGTAKRHSEVNIYDNEVFIGKTSSKADGSWTATCELYKPYSHSFHEIHAKIKTDNGMELTSETQQVEYDKNNLVPQRVTMLYNGSFVEFDLLQGITTPNHYTFVPSIGDFTFFADFTRNDDTQIKNVNIKVLNSDGTVRTLPATFDSKQNKWVTTTKYSSSSRLPQNVDVEYELIPVDIQWDPSRINDDSNQNKNIILNYIANADSTKCFIIEVSDSMCLSQYQTLSNNSPIYIRTSVLKYDDWIDHLLKGRYLTIENDDQLTYIEDSVMLDRHASWIWTQDEKKLLLIEVFQEKIIPMLEPQESRARARLPWWQSVIDGISRIPIFTIREINREFNDGFREYLFWFDNYSKIETKQRNLYIETEKMLKARCPDGTLRLANSQYEYGKMLLDNYWNDTKNYWEEYLRNLEVVRRDLDSRRNAASAISAFLSLASIVIKPTSIASSIGRNIDPTLLFRFGRDVPIWLRRALGNRLFDGLLDNSMAGLSGYVNDGISDILQQLLYNWYTPEQFFNWYNIENAKIENKYINLQASIKQVYRTCPK